MAASPLLRCSWGTSAQQFANPDQFRAHGIAHLDKRVAKWHNGLSKVALPIENWMDSLSFLERPVLIDSVCLSSSLLLSVAHFRLHVERPNGVGRVLGPLLYYNDPKSGFCPIGANTGIMIKLSDSDNFDDPLQSKYEIPVPEVALPNNVVSFEHIEICSRGSSRSTSSRSGSSRSRSASRSASSRSRSQRSDSRSGSADSHRHSGHKHKASSSRNKSHRALTSAERKAVLDAHNKYRSKLARGRARNRGGKRLPKAANMVKLRYNVELEKYAEAWAKRCWFEHSSGYEHARDEEARYRDSGGYGENLAIMGHEDRKVDALKRASVIWWDELEECGIDSDTLVYISARKQKCLLGHWTQMAWATSTEMGCAVAHCDSIREKKKDNFGSGDHIVCHYTPSGNWIDKTVYKSGPTCSECPNGSHCDRKSGLCVY